MKRSGKFYRKNEAEVMEIFGLKPTPNSGSGWVVKEDGDNEHIICQLKSTDANSIKVNKLDIDKLLHNASVSHKLPLFMIQFIQSNEIYLVIKPENLEDMVKYLETKEYQDVNTFVGIDLSEHEDSCTVNVKRQIKSCSKSREKFREEQEKKFKKERRSAK